MVSFKWKMLVVSGLKQVNNYGGLFQMETSGGLHTVNDSSQLQIENYRNWAIDGERLWLVSNGEH